MISHDHRFIFLHIPKTAGVSINSVLRNYSPEPEFNGGHPSLGDYARCGFVEDYFSFAFCRNPYDRFVSVFAYYKRGGGNLFDYELAKDLRVVDAASYKLAMTTCPDHYAHGRPSENIPKGLSFEKFVLSLTPERIGLARPRHLNPQINFSLDMTCLDFVGRFENLQEDFSLICEKTGIPYEPLPHKNKSKSRNYRDYYNKETAEHVYHLYKKDFETFNYSRDLYD